jgi:hypothetical protein
MYPPEPLPSSHIDTPLTKESTKASNRGEKAKIKPTRINGNTLNRLPMLILYCPRTPSLNYKKIIVGKI